MSDIPKLHNIVNNKKRFDLVMRAAESEFYVKAVGSLLFHWLDYRECDELLWWIIKHNYTGKNLLCLYRDRFNFSPLNLTKWVLKEIHKEKEVKPVIIGRDYLNKKL